MAHGPPSLPPCATIENSPSSVYHHKIFQYTQPRFHERDGPPGIMVVYGVSLVPKKKKRASRIESPGARVPRRAVLSSCIIADRQGVPYREIPDPFNSSKCAHRGCGQLIKN